MLLVHSFRMFFFSNVVNFELFFSWCTPFTLWGRPAVILPSCEAPTFPSTSVTESNEKKKNSTAIFIVWFHSLQLYVHACSAEKADSAHQRSDKGCPSHTSVCLQRTGWSPHSQGRCMLQIIPYNLHPHLYQNHKSFPSFLSFSSSPHPPPSSILQQWICTMLPWRCGRNTRAMM